MADTKTKPQWLKVTYDQTKVDRMNHLLDGLQLNTVCAEANCPNLGDCFGSGTASFMIMGPNCTRACRFCDVPHGKTAPIDLLEPLRVAQATQKLGLKHVVVTSVDRDDLPDLGATQFVNVIKEIRRLNPNTSIEVLTPDFQGRTELLDQVIAAKPDVFNHNMETVRSLTPKVRSRATYDTSLKVLQYVKAHAPKTTFVKTGIMLGLGETDPEVYQLMDDLRAIDVDFLTIGQYVQPSKKHYQLREWVPMARYQAYYQVAMAKGFKFVASSPLVRSSYKAKEELEAVDGK
ncbi:lipoyl synthase [Agrilactobacillus composti DSM 18527 = JCM 14202]|uniref:Lipoyl synthase n=1 Tax=Agrilactobacillus composti DSM 18527 = JCM 14202 TaxID=1423734 RepID=X0PEM1_9LACO|nr:lipoyl synthase [Agrilactobacillus composti]KRM35182.1 lipoyl synthase [Agrilactobacillus composti DSM 18527 = JCM 14202]GAF40184.1 lipoate synthase [Agrilactobacillus composti DSM 18527 = JCM 14202]